MKCFQDNLATVVRMETSGFTMYNLGQKCWYNCWKQDYFSQIGGSCKIPSPPSPIQCWTKSSSQEQHCMGEGGCGWRFWLVVYRHLSWIYVFYELSQEVLSGIVGEWNVFVQGWVRSDFCPEIKNWNISSFCHFAFSCFKHARWHAWSSPAWSNLLTWFSWNRLVWAWHPIIKNFGTEDWELSDVL